MKLPRRDMKQRINGELRWYYQDSAAAVGMSAAGLEPGPVMTPASAPPPSAMQQAAAKRQSRIRLALARLDVGQQAILEICYQVTLGERVRTCPECNASTSVDCRGEGARDVCSECSWYSGLRDVTIDLGYGAGNNAVRKAWEASADLKTLQRNADVKRHRQQRQLHLDRLSAARDQIARDVMARVKPAHQRYVEVRTENRDAESEVARRAPTPAQRVVVARTAEIPLSRYELERNAVAAFIDEIGLDDMPRVRQLVKAERTGS